MSLFQKSVLNKHLKSLDKDKVGKAFENFKKFYGNKLRLHNIMQLKEENYQEGFLREFFVGTLGYTINPNENYNLTTEYKNQKDARKADGAILIDNKAIGVIELKSTKTKNLESIKEQAFSYKNNQPGCRYIITSNFQSLRFYVDDATEYEEFNLFDLAASKEPTQRFKLLYLLLSKNSIFSNLPLKLKEETKFHESDISAKLYKDYKHFKDGIFNNLVKNNPQYDKLTLFKKSQKLLDRFLFVLFAEDSGLIPPNAISKIIGQWKQLQELDEYKPLYTRFQKLFSHLNEGHKYKEWGEIPAYNGGLFRKDEILDSPGLKIDDDVLLKDSQKLTAYDFNSEIDVNILGHIFEHSLNEIEEIASELQGENIDKKKSKRKKDGIFYTPKYITKYIIENTVGILCKEKKEELQIRVLLIDDSYSKKDGKLSKKGKQLFNTLNNYKNWLLTLKILDPACGSGAFLNQTLDFLIAEHKQIDDLIAELTGENIRLFDTDKAILENNIYGVDINEESVEIAKLSLWLRTAQRGRPLSDLSGNIKCGNSLIDDPEIAGDKAFDWHKEFPHVFNPTVKEKNYRKKLETTPDYAKLIKEKAQKAEKLAREALEISKQVYKYAEKIQGVNEPKEIYGTSKGGFDVVLGNPPYVRSRDFDEQTNSYFLDKYNLIVSGYDLSTLFIEKAMSLGKKGAISAFITSNKFLSARYGYKLRQHLVENKLVSQVINLKSGVFADTPVETSIIIIKSNKNEYLEYINIIKSEENTEFVNKNTCKIKFSKLLYTKQLIFFFPNDSIENTILKVIERSNYKIGDFFNFNAGYGITNIKKLLNTSKINNSDIPVFTGKSIWRYKYLKPEYWIKPGKLKKYRADNTVLIRELSTTNRALMLQEGISFSALNSVTLVNCKKGEYLKSFLALFNSLLFNKIFRLFYETTRTHSNLRFKEVYIKDLPVGDFSKLNHAKIEENIDLMLSLNKELQTKTDKFIKRIKANFEAKKISNKLQNFYDFDFKTFIDELKKQKIKLNLAQQDEWEDYFDSYKQEINKFQNQINQTDKELDKMVYELYGLTDEEIEIIENSVNK